ncbi:hypothetical protein EV567_1341 [Streptomyces sp. BK239]|nr:hypothetical protein EV567_1341 [Streptomyces sp. BK239]
MDLMCLDAEAVRPDSGRPQPAPHITWGRVAAPTRRAQLHTQDSEIPAPTGGYLHARPPAHGEAR